MTQVRALSLRWISATAVAWFLVTSAIAAAATASTPTANPESEVASAFEGKTFAILVGFPPGGPQIWRPAYLRVTCASICRGNPESSSRTCPAPAE